MPAKYKTKKGKDPKTALADVIAGLADLSGVASSDKELAKKLRECREAIYEVVDYMREKNYISTTSGASKFK